MSSGADGHSEDRLADAGSNDWRNRFVFGSRPPHKSGEELHVLLVGREQGYEMPDLTVSADVMAKTVEDQSPTLVASRQHGMVSLHGEILYHRQSPE